MNDGLTFGEYLRRLRHWRRLQAKAVAARAGLSCSHLSRFENDKLRPSVESVVRLAAALDADLAEMLRRSACLPPEVLDLLPHPTRTEAAS